MTQGAGIITGLQSSFDWRGVASSAAGTVAGQAAGKLLGDAVGASSGDPWAKEMLTRTGAGLAAGTVASIAQGGRISLQQVATDAFGNAIGESIAAASRPVIKTLQDTSTPAERITREDIGKLPQVDLQDLEPLNPAALKLQLGDTDAFRQENLSRIQRMASDAGAVGGEPAPFRVEIVGYNKEASALAGARASMDTFWSQYAEEGVADRSFGKYLLGQTLRKLGNFAYDVADMGLAVYNSPDQAVVGGAKSIVNFGPDAFNFAANGVKTILNGYSLIGEQLGAGEGTFAGFRGTDAYNIKPLLGYDNQAQAGGALLTQTALGVGLAKYGDYSIEWNPSSAGTLYSNPMPFRLVPPELKLDFTDLGGVLGQGGTRSSMRTAMVKPWES